MIEEERETTRLQTELAKLEVSMNQLATYEPVKQEAIVLAVKPGAVVVAAEQDFPKPPESSDSLSSLPRYSFSFTKAAGYSCSISRAPLTTAESPSERETGGQTEGHNEGLFGSGGTAGTPTPGPKASSEAPREDQSNELSRGKSSSDLKESPLPAPLMRLKLDGLAAMTSLVEIAILYLVGRPGALPTFQVAEVTLVWALIYAVLWILPGGRQTDHKLPRLQAIIPQ
jgi:hypothetical protein